LERQNFDFIAGLEENLRTNESVASELKAKGNSKDMKKMKSSLNCSKSLDVVME